MIKVYTIQMAQWRTLVRYNRKVDDVTIKSFDFELKKLFAPPNMRVVNMVKNGELTPSQFDAVYRKHVNKQIEENPHVLEDLLDRDELILSCFCGKDVDYCHRHKAADILKTKSKELGIELELMGEITSDNVDHFFKGE